MSEIRFYLDENISPEIAEQLARHEIDAVHVRDLETLGDSDENHLQRATAMGRVLCTQDDDFLRMHSEGFQHTGIAFTKQSKANIGGWVRELRKLHAAMTAEEMIGQVRFLSMK